LKKGKVSIQVREIKGDIVELIFNPKEEDIRIGENLSIKEKVGGRGLVVQVIEFRTITYPSLVQEMLQLAIESSNPPPPGLFEFYKHELSAYADLKIALAKIRKLKDFDWEQWDGWIPTRDVVVERISDEEVATNCLRDLGNPLRLGKTLRGEDFFVEGRDLEKVNIITGVKGSGKSHLAKVLLLELIKRGAIAIVFDINKEYIHLPSHEVNFMTGDVSERGIIHLEAGGNFKIGVRQFGVGPLLTMLQKFGLPQVSAMHFENRLSHLFSEMDEWERRGRKPPFIGIRELIQMAEEGEFSSGYGTAGVVDGAIRSRLAALRNTRVFAANAREAASFRDYYEQIKGGGALVMDIADLSNLARSGFVQAIIEMIKEICEEEIEKGSERFPFLFFEEAHLYVSRASIDYIVTRARHLGITSFFITNMITGLDEAVLRQADNLFLLNLPFEGDVRHVAKSAITDYETISSFVKRLRKYHTLLIGRCTNLYPLIFRVDPLEGINTAGETRFFFKKLCK
jgi:hypothetical protein